MSRFGQLHKYQANQEPVSAYLEQVALFFQANDILEGKQVALLLSIVGGHNLHVRSSEGLSSSAKATGEASPGPFHSFEGAF